MIVTHKLFELLHFISRHVIFGLPAILQLKLIYPTGHEELCSLLGYFGLDASGVDKFGHTALHLAVKGAGFWTVHAIINKVPGSC